MNTVPSTHGVQQMHTFSPSLLPGSCRIACSPDDWARDVLAKITTTTRAFAYHINLSYTAAIPHDREKLNNALAERGIVLLNHRAVDISKTSLQSACIAAGLMSLATNRDGDPEEVLIVKTDLNFGGFGEKALTVEQQRRLGVDLGSHDISAKSYKILPRKDIQDHQWNDPTLVIERFVTNTNHRFCRTYWLGKSLVVSDITDPLPIKKIPHGVPRTDYLFTLHREDAVACRPVPRVVEHVGNNVARLIQSAGIEFGTADVVIDNDENPFIIDLNTTPSWGDTSAPTLTNHLRQGLDAFVS